MTPPRQVWLFQLGCWTAVAAALLHVSALLVVPGGLSEHATAALAQTSPPHVFRVPGLRQPTFLGVLEGMSLGVPILLASIGAAGLVVARRGSADPRLVRGVAGAFALGTGALLLLSIAQFFSLLTFVLAIVAMCFALAAVPET